MMDAPPAAYVASATAFSTEERVDSPRPPSASWTGILIAAPKEGRVSGAAEPVIVRGTFRIKAPNYPAKARWKLVVIDAAQKRREADMGQREAGEVTPETDEVLDEKTKAALTYVGHFNADIFQTFGAPLPAGTYRLFATLGPLQSNEISIKIVAP